MKREIEYKIRITIDNKMTKIFEEKIIEWLTNNVSNEDSQLGEFQDSVLDDIGVDDDLGFSDVGVKIETEIKTKDVKETT